MTDAPQTSAASGVPTTGTGARLREARERRGISLRELARRLQVSPGHISGIERDLVAPSISLLYSIVGELGLSMDVLFRTSDESSSAPNSHSEQEIPRSPGEARYVRRAPDRQTIDVRPGVRWELLTPSTDAGVDFREIVYTQPVPSGDAEEFIRHSGHEYGVVLEGRLHVQVEFDVFVLGPGDSIAFDSSRPHKFWNQGPGRARTVWVSGVGS